MTAGGRADDQHRLTAMDSQFVSSPIEVSISSGGAKLRWGGQDRRYGGIRFRQSNIR